MEKRKNLTWVMNPNRRRLVKAAKRRWPHVKITTLIECAMTLLLQADRLPDLPIEDDNDDDTEE